MFCLVRMLCFRNGDLDEAARRRVIFVDLWYPSPAPSSSGVSSMIETSYFKLGEGSSPAAHRCKTSECFSNKYRVKMSCSSKGETATVRRNSAAPSRVSARTKFQGGCLKYFLRRRSNSAANLNATCTLAHNAGSSSVSAGVRFCARCRQTFTSSSTNCAAAFKRRPFLNK